MPSFFSKNRKNTPFFALDSVLPPASYTGGLSSLPAFPCPLRACGERPRLPFLSVTFFHFLNFFNVLSVTGITLFHKLPFSGLPMIFLRPFAPPFDAPRFPSLFAPPSSALHFLIKKGLFFQRCFVCAPLSCAHVDFADSLILLGVASPFRNGAGWLFFNAALFFCSSFPEMLLTLKSNFIIHHSCAFAHVFLWCFF